MFIFAIILLVIFFIVFFEAIKAQVDSNHTQEILNTITTTIVQNYKPWSLSEYYDRIEKVSLDIVSEKKKNDNYKLTLWLLSDGLQLNEDGTTQWIKREHEEENQAEENKPIQDFVPQNSFQNMQNVSPSYQTLNSIQSQINCLQFQNQYSLLQQQMQLQTQNMINPVYQSYLFYRPFCAQSTLTSCCCNSLPQYVKW